MMQRVTSRKESTKHVDCTSKTRTMIGRFPIARTVSEYENQILIGQIRERNVVRKKAAVSGEERCVTSLKTAAKETRRRSAYQAFYFLAQQNFYADSG